jgi:hypothetical protein
MQEAGIASTGSWLYFCDQLDRSSEKIQDGFDRSSETENSLTSFLNPRQPPLVIDGLVIVAHNRSPLKRRIFYADTYGNALPSDILLHVTATK